MTRAAVGVAVTAGVVGGLIGAAVDPVAGAVAGAAVGAIGAVPIVARDRQRINRLTTQVEHWLDEGADHASVVVTGDGPWRRLGVALNRVGDVFTRQRTRLRDEQPWRHELVHSLVSAAVLFDGDGRLVAANQTALELLSIPDDGVHRTIVQVLGSAVLADAVARAREERGIIEVDADLADRQVHASVATVGTETLVIVTDRTRERRVEELRRNFVVNASHELKTPATSIQALAEALEIMAEQDPIRVPDLVARLREESERLVRLVHDLLNLRRLEDRSQVEPVPMDLVAAAASVVAELGERAEERDITLELHAPDVAAMSGDPDDVRLIIRNLVTNAIQYNRDGGRVDVRVERLDDRSWGVDVADTGIGIPQQDIQRVFERFYRVDVARSRQTGGTGLGLSIVRHAVERHHGTIRVDSLLGEGTTFRVTLPADDPTVR